jgi:hypothetical protein
MARITLADVEHVLEWKQIHGPSPTSDDWHQELGDMIGDLLALEANPFADFPTMSAYGDDHRS